MTIDEFDEYAAAHDYVVFTRQQFEHVIDVFNNYELLLLDYDGRLKADMVAMLDKIRAEIEANMESIIGKYDSHTPTRDIPSAKIERNSAREECLQIIDKYKIESEPQESEDKE